MKVNCAIIIIHFLLYNSLSALKVFQYPPKRGGFKTDYRSYYVLIKNGLFDGHPTIYTIRSPIIGNNNRCPASNNIQTMGFL